MRSENTQSASQSLAGLKFLFAAMILVLLGGALFLFVSIYERNQGKNTASVCQGDIDIPLDGEVIAFQKEVDTVTLLVNKDDGSQRFVVIDGCRGDIIRTITLQNGAQEQEEEYPQNFNGVEQENSVKEDVPPVVPHVVEEEKVDKEKLRRALENITVKDAK